MYTNKKLVNNSETVKLVNGNGDLYQRQIILLDGSSVKTNHLSSLNMRDQELDHPSGMNLGQNRVVCLIIHLCINMRKQADHLSTKIIDDGSSVKTNYRDSSWMDDLSWPILNKVYCCRFQDSGSQETYMQLIKIKDSNPHLDGKRNRKIVNITIIFLIALFRHVL